MKVRFLSSLFFAVCLLSGVQSATLNDALDNTNFVWVTSGDVPWAFTSDVTHDGSDAAGAQLGSNQVAILETTVTGPIYVTFWCKFQRTSIADSFQLKLDSDVRYTFLPGAVGWRFYEIGVPQGVHTLRWQYNKWSAASPTNGAWLDQVTYKVGPLTWNGAESMEWNTNATNWAGARNVFQNGDAAIFNSTNFSEIFVGENGLPHDVAPAYFSVQGNSQFRGGDIAGGPLWVNDGNAAFVGYSNSLSFTGGVNFADSGTLTFDASSLADGSAFHIGTDPIRAANYFGRLIINLSNQTTVTLENDLDVQRGMIFEATNGTIRYSGRLELAMPVSFRCYNRTSAQHIVDGPVILDQEDRGSRMIEYPTFHEAQHPLVINGSISDGPGQATNRLQLYPYYTTIVLAASNSYAHGTRVEYSGNVVVLPGATLGTGDVEAFGHLVLTSSNNISPTARLNVSYELTVTNRANIRVASVRWGETLYTNVFFSPTNGPAGLHGDGTLRAPATNLAPDVIVLGPTNDTEFNPGQTVSYQLQPSDRDGVIQRVQFFLDGVRVRDRTNLAFTSSFISAALTNVPAGRHTLHAMVTDDEGATTTTQPVNVFVRARVTIRMLPGGVVMEFPAVENESYTVQSSPMLHPPNWENVATFPAEPNPRLLILTNAVSSDATSRFFRVISP